VRGLQEQVATSSAAVILPCADTAANNCLNSATKQSCCSAQHSSWQQFADSSQIQQDQMNSPCCCRCRCSCRAWPALCARA
jgi:hypothetical protein